MSYKKSYPRLRFCYLLACFFFIFLAGTPPIHATSATSKKAIAPCCKALSVLRKHKSWHRVALTIAKRQARKPRISQSQAAFTCLPATFHQQSRRRLCRLAFCSGLGLASGCAGWFYQLSVKAEDKSSVPYPRLTYRDAYLYDDRTSQALKSAESFLKAYKGKEVGEKAEMIAIGIMMELQWGINSYDNVCDWYEDMDYYAIGRDGRAMCDRLAPMQKKVAALQDLLGIERATFGDHFCGFFVGVKESSANLAFLLAIFKISTPAGWGMVAAESCYALYQYLSREATDEQKQRAAALYFQVCRPKEYAKAYAKRWGKVTVSTAFLSYAVYTSLSGLGEEALEQTLQGLGTEGEVVAEEAGATIEVFAEGSKLAGEVVAEEIGVVAETCAEGAAEVTAEATAELAGEVAAEEIGVVAETCAEGVAEVTAEATAEVAGEVVAEEAGAVAESCAEGAGEAIAEEVGSSTKSAYQAAKGGGRHAGDYRNYVKRSPKELEKSIKSYTKQIKNHENLMKDPNKYFKEYGKEINGKTWNQLDPRHQEALLKKHWPKEIALFKEKINILEGILKNEK